MTLEDLGYNDALKNFRKELNLDSFGIGRVIQENKDRYIVKAIDKDLEAELIGNLRFSAESRLDLPAVGDWVAISEFDENRAMIHAVLPRHSILERQAVGKISDTQVIATNIDFGLIVQSGNRDFNLNRLERYLTICHAAKIEPVIILSKVDLVDQEKLTALKDSIQNRLKGTKFFAVSSETKVGLDEVRALIVPGKTYCLLGSSGVGKSTLLNRLAGEKLMSTGEISELIDRGKHVTTHRELIVLEDGGVIIDNPGMREVGITTIAQGIETTFDEISDLAESCKYNDCTHSNEEGCAILEALESGKLNAESYENFLKMEKERAFLDFSVQERRQKDKNLGKMIKNVQKERRRNKY